MSVIYLKLMVYNIGHTHIQAPKNLYVTLPSLFGFI